MKRLTTCAAMALFGLGVALIPGNALAQGEGPPLQAAPVAATAFPVWKRLTLGTYKGVNALRAAFDAARVRVGDSADEILGRPGFAFSQTRTDVDLVVVSLAELGFNDRTSLADIHRRAGELGLELCAGEVAPLLRLQYADQPIGEFLNIAMRPIATYGGQLIALSVANAGTGPLLLGGEAPPDSMVSRIAKFVFVRPQRIALPDRR
jgi:hypothetical protein